MMTCRRFGFIVLMCFALSSRAWAGDDDDDEEEEDFYAAARVSDIPYIRCAVCDAFVYHALGHVAVEEKTLRSKGKRLTEAVTLELLETLCDPSVEAGRWLKHMDIIEDEEVLRLQFMEQGLPHCNTECRTIIRVCEEIQDGIDMNLLSEIIFKNKLAREELRRVVCVNPGNNFCVRAPPVPRDRKPGPVFPHDSTDPAFGPMSRSKMPDPSDEELDMEAAENVRNEDDFRAEL